jgi:hypothetical protein
MNVYRVFHPVVSSIERTPGAARCRGKTGEAEISTAPARAILAHPGEEFFRGRGHLRCAAPIARA